MGAGLARRISTIPVLEMAVPDKVDEIVARAIEHTRALIKDSPDRWEAARRGLEAIHDDLARASPRHPALSRLQAFIARGDRRAL